jgi:hypothetical protein
MHEHALRKIMSNITLQDRLDYGYITIDEFRALNGNQSKSSFYKGLKAGKLLIERRGRKSLVPGPVAKCNLAGKAIPTTREGA